MAGRLSVVLNDPGTAGAASRLRWSFLIPGPIDRMTGGTVYDRRIVEGARAAGDEVTVVSLPGRFPHELTQEDNKTARIALDTLAADDAPVVADGLILPSLSRELSDFARTHSLVALIHHPVSEEPGLDHRTRGQLWLAESRVILAAARVICTSGYTRRLLIDRGIPEQQIEVVCPGVDTPDVSGPDHNRPGRTEPPENTLRLLCVANLMERKGLSTLIDAMKVIESTLDAAGDVRGGGTPGWSLTIVGSDNMEPATARNLKAQVDTCGLAERICFVGSLPAPGLSRLYRDADLFVFPSLYEGYGMVLTEAAAHGLPIVTTNGGAIPDTVRGLAAEVVPAGVADALAEAIGRFLGDSDHRERMRRMAKVAAGTLEPWGIAVERFRRLVAAMLR